MNRMVNVILALLVVATGACTSKPPKKQFQRLAGEFVSPVHITKPVDQQSAVIGITINTDKWSPLTEDRVYLVKIENERDMFQGTKLIPTKSGFHLPAATEAARSMCKMCHLAVAAVAFTASEKGFGKVREVTLFLLPKAMVKQTETTVAAGGISFMGAYEWDLPRWSSKRNRPTMYKCTTLRCSGASRCPK